MNQERTKTGSIKEAYFANARIHFEDAHKEYVVRAKFNSVLAPSKELLDAWRDEKISWQEYAQKYRAEILNNPEAIKRIKELIELSKTKDVYLISYETLARNSHRHVLLTIIREFMKNEG